MKKKTPELHKPVKQKGGWYFYFERRDGKVCRCGPEPTPAILQRMIDSRVKCSSCDAFVYSDPTIVVQEDRPDDGHLCVMCEPEFVEWCKIHDDGPPPLLKRVQ